MRPARFPFLIQLRFDSQAFHRADASDSLHHVCAGQLVVVTVPAQGPRGHEQAHQAHVRAGGGIPNIVGTASAPRGPPYDMSLFHLTAERLYNHICVNTARYRKNAVVLHGGACISSRADHSTVRFHLQRRQGDVNLRLVEHVR